MSSPAAAINLHPVSPGLPSIPSSHSSAPLPQIFSLYTLARPAPAEKNLVCGLYIPLDSHEDQASHGHRLSPSSGSSLTVRTVTQRNLSHKVTVTQTLSMVTHRNDSDEGDRGIVRKGQWTSNCGAVSPAGCSAGRSAGCSTEKNDNLRGER